MILKEEERQAHQRQRESFETPPPYTPRTQPGAQNRAETQPPAQQQQQQQQPPSTVALASQVPFDQPSASASSSESAPLPQTIPVQCPPHLKPSNYIHIRRENRLISGEFAIDPSLPNPTAGPSLQSQSNFLPGEPWPNLRLVTTNANINADVWLVGKGNVPAASLNGTPRRRNTLAIMDCKNAFVNVTMNANCASHPFDMKITCHNGGVKVYLPTSFVGPLTTHTKNGWVSIASWLSANVTTFSDVRGNRKCFVGDFASSGYGYDQWTGSSLDITCENGRIKLYYADPLPPQKDNQYDIVPKPSTNTAFWKYLFNKDPPHVPWTLDEGSAASQQKGAS